MTKIQRLKYSTDGTTWQTSDIIATTPGVPVPSWTNMGATYNNLNASWPAASLAVSYNVYLQWPGQPKYLYGNQTATTFSWNFGAYDTKHEMWVESVSSGGGLSGQAYISGCSGHPQTSKSGSFNYECRPAGNTATWRNDGNNWSYNGDDVLQGYFSNAAYNAYGAASYDGPAFQNWVSANYGSDVIANLQWNDLALMVYRDTATGTGSAVSQTWYVSSCHAQVGGGPPSLAGGTAMGSHTRNAAGVWDRGLSNWWGGHVLRNENVAGTGVVWSMVMMRNNATDYSRYFGYSDASNAMNMYVSCSWNFVNQNQANTYAC